MPEKGIVFILKDKKVLHFEVWQVALFLTGVLMLSGLTFYYMTTTASLVEERKELQELLVNKEKVESDLKAVNDANEGLKTQLEEVKLTLADTEVALDKKETELKDKQTDLENSNKQITKLKEEHKKANDYIKEIESELSVIEDNFELYKSELTNFTEATGTQEGVAVFDGN